MARAARRARAGSSSWAIGTPKTAMTASPMNFSTVPPRASISSRAMAKYSPIRSRTTSASSDSARPVEPVMSANRRVTSFRSSPAGAAASIGAPQWGQKANRAATSRAQDGQLATSRVYAAVSA